MTTARLRACPTCLTPVDEVNLGLRDFRWVNEGLPGKVGLMDLDGMLERGGEFLVLELKPTGAVLGMGQRLTYKALVRKGFTVLVVRGDGPVVTVSRVNDQGRDVEPITMMVGELAQEVRRWWDDHAPE